MGARASVSAMIEQLDELRAENAKLKKDAGRYRWLRGDAPAHSERWMRWELRRWDGKSWNSLKGTALDAAIDKAKKAA
jgi:hypothetical protein